MTDQTFARDDDRDSRGSAAALPSRRALLRGAVLAGVALPTLAACGSGSSSNNAEGTAGSGGGGGGATKGQVIAKTSDVPEGGGVILDQDGIVLTQPDPGDFKGFSNICTHQHCPVSTINDGNIICLCHGSEFSIKDGSVVAGPAPTPLPAKAITVKGKNIQLA